MTVRRKDSIRCSSRDLSLVEDDEVGRQRGYLCLDRLQGPRRGNRLSGIVQRVAHVAESGIGGK